MMENIWSLVRGNRSKLLRCSFCAKTQNEVQKLLAGPKVYICDECVDRCIDTLSQDLGKKPQGCSLCGSTHEMQKMTRIPGRGPICGSCLGAVRTVIGDVLHRDSGKTT